MRSGLASRAELTVQASLVRLFTETLVCKGLDLPALLARVDIDPADLRRPETRLPVSKFDRLWDLAFDLTGDATIALSHARRFQPATYHVLGMALFSSATLQEASERAVRYARVLSDEPLVGCDLVGDEFRVSVAPEGAPTRRVSILANVLQVWRMLAGRDLQTLYVTIAGVPRPAADTAFEFRTHFGCPVQFDADATRLAIRAAEARRPLDHANAALARRGEAVIEAYLAELDRIGGVPTMGAQVLEALSAGRFDKARVARHLGVSPSTLQRRLSAEGITFRQVVEQARRDLAETYVRQGGHSIKEIAHLLGYSDLSNFTRAFRGWFGVPPTAYQEGADGASEGPPAMAASLLAD